MEEELYKKMYLHLFNAVTDVLDSPEHISPALRLRLIDAQRACEDIYIKADEKNSPN